MSTSVLNKSTSVKTPGLLLSRDATLRKSAALAAEALFALENGHPDPTVVYVNGRLTIAPYTATVTAYSKDANRGMRIHDGRAEMYLTSEEEKQFTALMTQYYAELLHQATELENG